MLILKMLSEYTLDDALYELEKGFHCICGDGKIKYMSNDDRD